MLAERHLLGSGRGARHERQELLGELHEHLIVHVGPVELEHRELGVVLRRDALIPEVTIDLEHPFDSAHGQPLEVQLRRDAQEQLHVERVVMRDERPGQRAAGERLHHRRLDLEEAMAGEEVAHRGHRPAADFEHPAHVRVDDEIQIALPIADLHVLETMPLLGQRDEALGQERRATWPRSTARWSWSGRGGPATPSWSPKSSSFDSSYSRADSESCRTYTWIRARPSDSTRNAALPKFRMLTIRPAVTVSTREASSSAASAGRCAATSALTVWVVAKRLG